MIELTLGEITMLFRVPRRRIRELVRTGHIPAPVRSTDGILRWRVIDLTSMPGFPAELRSIIHIEVARTYSRFRANQQATWGWLAQLGISADAIGEAVLGMDPAGLDVALKHNVRWVMRERRELRRRLAGPEGRGDHVDSHEAIRHTARRVVNGGADVYVALADLTVALTGSGYPERLLPRVYDDQFWQTQDNVDAFAAYLEDCPEVRVPNLAWGDDGGD